ncbi:hypothetical protein F4604DRAFT_1683300 [Suillus subluteus]|nr:hypothetical protein F4604DRAFT_1683300 [Suillus subluteus]
MGNPRWVMGRGTGGYRSPGNFKDCVMSCWIMEMSHLANLSFPPICDFHPSLTALEATVAHACNDQDGALFDGHLPVSHSLIHKALVLRPQGHPSAATARSLLPSTFRVHAGDMSCSTMEMNLSIYLFHPCAVSY